MKYKDCKVGMKVKVTMRDEDYLGKVYTISELGIEEGRIKLEGKMGCTYRSDWLEPAIDYEMQKLKKEMLG